MLQRLMKKEYRPNGPRVQDDKSPAPNKPACCIMTDIGTLCRM